MGVPCGMYLISFIFVEVFGGVDILQILGHHEMISRIRDSFDRNLFKTTARTLP